MDKHLIEFFFEAYFCLKFEIQHVQESKEGCSYLPKHFEQKVSDSILTFVNPQDRNKVNRLLPIKSIKLVETDGGEDEFVDVD